MLHAFHFYSNYKTCRWFIGPQAVNNELYDFALFGSETDIRTLAQCSTAYMDATFKTAPKSYYQMLCIHGKVLELDCIK